MQGGFISTSTYVQGFLLCFALFIMGGSWVYTYEEALSSGHLSPLHYKCPHAVSAPVRIYNRPLRGLRLNMVFDTVGLFFFFFGQMCLFFPQGEGGFLLTSRGLIQRLMYPPLQAHTCFFFRRQNTRNESAYFFCIAVTRACLTLLPVNRQTIL